MHTDTASPPERTVLRPLRVLILSAKSGGGHDGTANALRHLLQRALSGELGFQCIDVYGSQLRLLPWLARVRQHTYRLWQVFFRVTQWPWLFAILRTILTPVLTRSVVARITIEPDLVIATHFAGAQVLEAIAQRLPKRPATLIVATDYEPHRAWWGQADLTLAAQGPGLASAQALGINTDRLVAIPLLPCLPPVPRDAAATTPERFRIIAVMGAEGTSGEQLTDLLAKLCLRPFARRVEIEIVCGHNTALMKSLATTRFATQSSHDAADGQALHLTITGFASDLPRRLAHAHLCLLRASPLIMTEAIAAGTPVLAFDWHAHEAANARLLATWGCGRASQSTQELLEILETWVVDSDAFLPVREAAQRMARQAFSTHDLLRVLGQLPIDWKHP